MGKLKVFQIIALNPQNPRPVPANSGPVPANPAPTPGPNPGAPAPGTPATKKAKVMHTMIQIKGYDAQDVSLKFFYYLFKSIGMVRRVLDGDTIYWV